MDCNRRSQTLVEACVFCIKENLNDLLEANGQQFLSLGNELLDKIIDLVGNLDAEAVACHEGEGDGDRTCETEMRENFASVLFCGLILSLVKAVPEKQKGHYWSLYDVFRCKNCDRLVPPKICHRLVCGDFRVIVNRNGDVKHTHEVDREWNLNDHITQLKRELTNWRAVYWRLWSECHYLYCTVCHVYYNVSEYDDCRNHCDKPMFDLIDGAGIKMQPFGQYTCCKKVAFRYQTIKRLMEDGCKKVNHKPREWKADEKETLKISLLVRNQILANKDRPRRIDMIRDNSDDYMTTPETRIKSYRLGILDKGISSLNIQLQKGIKGNSCEEPFNNNSLQSRPSTPLHNENENEPKTPIMLGRELHHLLTGNQNGINNYCYARYNLKTKKHKCRSKNTLCCWLPSYDATKPQDRDGTLYNEGCCLPIKNVNPEETFFNRPIQYAKRTNKHKRSKCGLQSNQWISTFSTRYNQDKQRECDIRFFSALTAALVKWSEITTSKQSIRCSVKGKDSGPQDSLTEEFGDSPGNLSSGNSTPDLSSESDDSSTSYCSTLNSAVRVYHSRTTAVWNSFVPFAGTYIRIETETRSKHFKDKADSNAHEFMDETRSSAERQLSFRQLPNKQRKMPTYSLQQNHYNRKHQYKSSFKLNETLAYTPIVRSKVLEIPFTDNSPDTESTLWSFDLHSQELDYLSAAYIPLPVAGGYIYNKYYKTIKNELSNEWDELVDLERSWNAFLCLFYENESLPRSENCGLCRTRFRKRLPPTELH